jgi:A118 family predicted phage portal protein
MNNIVVERGAGLLFTQALLASAVRIFDKRGEATETPLENRAEGRWDLAYRQIERINFESIFAARLTNYVASGSSVSSDQDSIDELAKMAFSKAGKWLPMAWGIGRVFLVPYIIGDRIFLDIIPQSREVSLDMYGDEIHGFVAISDTRVVGKRKYARLTHYHFDTATKTFEVENRAVDSYNGNEIPLTSIKEWATIPPVMTFHGIERPLFAVVDCPKDNRDSDRPQGAPITYGCGDTIAQIYETIRDYQVEYRHKVSVLGIDQTMIDKNNAPGMLPREYVKANRGGMDSGDLFSVYSPDIRGQAYRDRLLELFGLLEKQVGTSRGILTPAESANATATEVRRSMYDTLVLVNSMRKNIETAFDGLAYTFAALLDLLGRRVTTDYTVTWDWSEDMTEDSAEEFSVLTQLHSAGVVSDVELRRYKYPNETPEEARRAIEEIRADKPDPYGEMLATEPFGGFSTAQDEGGANE